MLERCFRDVEQGFYIDVGASHPIRDSVTYWFYRRGWCGLNIDAALQPFRMLQRYRPRDINIHTFVSDKSDEIEFFDIGMSGLSSSNSRFAKHAEKRGFEVRPVRMPTTTLNDLCEKHCVQGVDFLKLDAEGAEAAILSGLDLQRWRPKIILLESIDPVNSELVEDRAGAILTAASYAKAYFDGINDYFVAAEAEHLARHFETPVNVLDGAVRWTDNLPDAASLSLEAIAWRRIFDLRLRRQWSAMSIDEEIESQLVKLGATAEAVTETVIVGLYHDLLGRNPGADEIRNWLAFQKKLGVSDLVVSILRSDEYCRKALEWGEL